jgi:3-hydroxyacyl-CoA dehydrogenase
MDQAGSLVLPVWLSRSATRQGRRAREGSAKLYRQSHRHLRRDAHTIKTMLDDGYSIEEVDKMTGQAVGRPKSATFRTFDLVGLDVFHARHQEPLRSLPEDEERDISSRPSARARWSSADSRQQDEGRFLQEAKGEGDKKEIWTLDTRRSNIAPRRR